MPSPRGRRWRGAWTGALALAPGLGLALALAGGCAPADGGPAARAGSVRSLTWSVVTGADPQVPDDEVLGSVMVGEALDPTWDLLGSRARVEAVTPPGATAPVHVLRLLGGPREGVQRVLVPLSDLDERFARVRVVMQQPKTQNVALSVRFSDGRAMNLHPEAMPGGPGLTSLEFDVPRVRNAEAAPVALELGLPWNGRAPGLVGFVLESVPMGRFLPAPDAEPTVVELDREGRPAVGLIPGRPLVTRLRVRRGDVLELALGRPRHLAGAPAQVRFELRSADDGELVRQLARPVPSGTWDTLRLALDGQVGEELELRATLSSGRPGAAVCALAQPLVLHPTDTPRRVLLVTSDTHRADHLGLAPGAVDVRTPALDALARRGALFGDARSATNITNPSHGALLTGLSVRDTGIVDNLTAVLPRAETLAEAFAAEGYWTVSATSTGHLRPSVSGLGQGFARVGFTVQSEEAAELAVAFLEDAVDEHPDVDAFLWLHVFDVHGPYQPPEADVRAYYGPGDPAAPDLAPLSTAQRPPWDTPVRDPKWFRAAYRGEVTALDRALRPLLEDPRLADGWIALTADHGECLGEGGVWWKHFGVHPRNLDVPLVLAGPGVEPGQVLGHPVSNTDLGRTLLDLAGHPDRPFPGRNLWSPEPPDAPRFALSSHALSASVQRGDHYLVLHLRPFEHRTRPEPVERHQVELFDLRADPACAVDRVRDEPELARELRALVVEWLSGAGPGLAAAEREQDAATLSALSALGYSVEVRETEDALWGPDDRDCTCDWCELLR